MVWLSDSAWKLFRHRVGCGVKAIFGVYLINLQLTVGGTGLEQVLSQWASPYIEGEEFSKNFLSFSWVQFWFELRTHLRTFPGLNLELDLRSVQCFGCQWTLNCIQTSATLCPFKIQYSTWLVTFCSSSPFNPLFSQLGSSPVAASKNISWMTENGANRWHLFMCSLLRTVSSWCVFENVSSKLSPIKPKDDW